MDLGSLQLSWLDCVLLALVLLGGFQGFRRGFVRAFLGLVGLVVAFPVAGMLTPGVSNFLQQQWSAVERLAAFLGQHIALPASFSSMDFTQPVSLPQILESLGAQRLPDPYINAIGNVFNDLVAAATSHGAQTVADFIFYAMALILLNTLIFVVLFSLFRVIINLVAAGSTRRMGLGFIGFFNRLAGLAFGLATAVAGLAVFLGIAAPFLGLDAMGWFAGAISSSAVARGLLHMFYLVSPWIVQGGELIAR